MIAFWTMPGWLELVKRGWGCRLINQGKSKQSNGSLTETNRSKSQDYLESGVVPQSTISLNTVFDTFADWEDQLKPYRNELEELGL